MEKECVRGREVTDVFSRVDDVLGQFAGSLGIGGGEAGVASLRVSSLPDGQGGLESLRSGSERSFGGKPGRPAAMPNVPQRLRHHLTLPVTERDHIQISGGRDNS